MPGRSSRAARAGRPAVCSAGLAAHPRGRRAARLSARCRQGNSTGGDMQNGPSVDQPVRPARAHAAPGRNAAFDTHSPAAEARGGDRQSWLAPTSPLGRAPKPGFRAPGTHNPPRMASPIRISLAWRPQIRSGGDANPSFRPVGAHKSPPVGTRIRVSRRLVPKNPLGWGRESAFRAGWRPQIPSGGVANPRIAPLAPTNPLRWCREFGFRAGWRPQIPSGGDANPSFAPVGAHKSPRVGMRIRVSRRLAPTNPLRWCRESSFPAGWRPQTPRTGAHAAQVDESGVRGTGARRAARRVDAPFVLVVASNGEKRIPERRVGQRRLAGCSE